MTRDPENTTPLVTDSQTPAGGGKADQQSGRGDPYRDPASQVGVGHAIGPMFGNFAAARKRPLPKWAAPLLASMLLIHVVLFATMWLKTIWDIEQLDRSKDSSDLAIGAPPPPPPPPPKGGVKPKDVLITPKKLKVKDIVQPVKYEPKDVPQVSSGDENGVEGGVDNGVETSPLPVAVAPPPPPPPPPAPPPNVAPTALEQKRIAGEKNIVPDDITKTEITRSGKDKLIGSYKLCITADGNIKKIDQLKSTGFPAYDSKIQNTIRGEWRYSPFMVNGKAAEVCTAVTFIYSQK